MPELPEVETIARQLEKVIVGKKVVEVDVLSSKSFQGQRNELLGNKIVKVDRHSKMVVWHLDNPDLVVLIHLKMTGQLVWRPKSDSLGKQIAGGHPSQDWNASLPNKHTRVVIKYGDGSVLFFNDLRKFGWVKLLPSSLFLEMLSKLPPDVTDKEFTLKIFGEILSRTRRSVKLVVMDQQKVGGLGNIYINDALNLAKINPQRPANSLKPAEVKKLYLAAKKVIDLGIKYGGATYSDYRDTRGQGGKYQEHFLVYGREGEKCHNCGGKIAKFSLGGRGTYWCPNCQV
jgi:formamidopyrimidine-DNA glycosylase